MKPPQKRKVVWTNLPLFLLLLWSAVQLYRANEGGQNAVDNLKMEITLLCCTKPQDRRRRREQEDRIYSGNGIGTRI